MQQRAPGLIGLGHTGQLYAGHLLRGHGSLVVFDLDRARVGQAVGLGARPAGSAGDLAAQCDDVVLALPHPDADQMIKPKAYVVPRAPDADRARLAADLRDHVRDKLAHIKCPRWFEVVDELPKTSTGKIQRFRLRQAAP